MWQLASKTSPEWVRRVETRPLELLSDHAHCELRAAASAQSLLARHANEPRLVQALCEVAREELAHFASVVELLHARGGTLGTAARNPYAEGLLALRSHRAHELLLDRLLVAALIEARSLERFVLLAEHLADRELAAFYRALVPAEAAHRALFVELAREHYPRARVDERLAELVLAEACIVGELPFEIRMHSGDGRAREEGDRMHAEAGRMSSEDGRMRSEDGRMCSGDARTHSGPRDALVRGASDA